MEFASNSQPGLWRSLYRSLVPTLARAVPTGLLQRYVQSFTPIFMLHRLEHPDYGIHGRPVASVRRVLEYTRKRRFHPLSLEQLVTCLRTGQNPPEKSIVFTIDDGFIDQYEIAGPLFAEFDIPLTCFVITDFLDGTLWPWDDQVALAVSGARPGSYEIRAGGRERSLRVPDSADRSAVIDDLQNWFKADDNERVYDYSFALFDCLDVARPAQIPREYTPMSWDQANDFLRAGHCIAPHSRMHRILSRLSDAESAAEIHGSIARVAEKITSPASVFAYPTGRAGEFSTREAAILIDAGITGAVTTVAEPVVPADLATPEHLMQLPRYSLPKDFADFVQYAEWVEFVKSRLRRRNRAH